MPFWRVPTLCLSSFFLQTPSHFTRLPLLSLFFLPKLPPRDWKPKEYTGGKGNCRMYHRNLSLSCLAFVLSPLLLCLFVCILSPSAGEYRNVCRLQGITQRDCTRSSSTLCFLLPSDSNWRFIISVIRKQTAVVTVFSVRCYNVTFPLFNCLHRYSWVEVIFIPCVIDHTTSK